MNVMCTAWILIDWPEQMEVMRFNTRVTISKRACVRARVCVCESTSGFVAEQHVLCDSAPHNGMVGSTADHFLL